MKTFGEPRGQNRNRLEILTRASYGVGELTGVPSVTAGVPVNVGVAEGAGDDDTVTVRVKVGVGVGWVPPEENKAELRPKLRQTIPATNIPPLVAIAERRRLSPRMSLSLFANLMGILEYAITPAKTHD